MRPSVLLTALVLAALPALSLFAAVDAEDPPPQYEADTLIIRLAPGPEVPTPEQLAADARRGVPLPGGLGVGSPREARPALSRRAGGLLKERLRQEPDSPRARLERYVVLRYPEGANLEAIAEALARNPWVEYVHRMPTFQLHLTPNDPLYTPTGNPQTHQWGAHTLNLDAAWDVAKGHAYVGLIDTGLDVDHEDLAPLATVNGQLVYLGGNFRPHFSFDFGDNTPPGPGEHDVDERQGTASTSAGHGTHVAGLVAANTGNGTGAAGTCWHCSLMMEKMANDSKQVVSEAVADSLMAIIDLGGGVVSMSFGHRNHDLQAHCGQDAAIELWCDAIEVAERRDLVLFASSGNFREDIAFPANDPRVVAVGGIEPSGNFWDFTDGDPRSCPFGSFAECGSNWSITSGQGDQDLVTPAVDVMSTFYVGGVWNTTVGCVDNPNPSGADPLPGYGLCTGTSMSSPLAAGIGGILRSINPTLSKDQIRHLLISNASRAGAWDPKLGFGIPDAGASATDAVGRSAGQPLPNRLTPLFSMYSFPAEDWFYTSFPQMGAARHWDTIWYLSQGPSVSWYGVFPGTECQVSPCSPPPAASVYVFTSDKPPFAGAPPLVPLYRMSYVGATASNPDNRDHVYTTEANGIVAFANVGYRLDGVEGYIFQRCSPEPSCIPTGAERLYRRYNAARDDHAIFPERELAAMESDGYLQASGNHWIGYVYPADDADFDHLIDGFERLAGTDPAASDSDCDGVGDGDEVLFYGATGYGDPRDGSCGQVIGETGQVAVNDQPQTVLLSRTYVDPVVLALPPTRFGTDASIVRLHSVQPDRFTLAIEEAPNLNGIHPWSETVSYLVLEAGRWALADGTWLEVGKETTNATVGSPAQLAGAFEDVGFSSPFPAPPVVLTQVQTRNDLHWVKTRQHATTSSGFKVALEEDEAQTTFHGTEAIGWVAISPRVGTWSGRRFQAGTTGLVVSHVPTAVSYAQTFAAEPQLIATIVTRQGGNPSALRTTARSLTGFTGMIEEDTTFDAEVDHIAEDVGFLAIEPGGNLVAAPR